MPPLDVPKHTWLSPKIEIRDTGKYGKGMFAKEPIKEDETVLVWGGNYVDKQEADKAKDLGKLVMQWDDNLYSVEDRGTDVGYFLNHSCDSNLWMKDTFTFTAKRNIQKEEEITADYCLWEEDDYVSKWDCKCGSGFCRHKVTGKDWMLPELQARYRHHFLPLINRKIGAMTR